MSLFQVALCQLNTRASMRMKRRVDVGLIHAGGKSHHKMTNILAPGFFIISSSVFCNGDKVFGNFYPAVSLLGTYSEQNQNIKMLNAQRGLSQCYNRER